MRYLMLTFLLCSCGKQKVEHEVKGSTTNHIVLEVGIPEISIKSIEQECSSMYTNRTDINLCIADKQKEYLDNVMDILNQLVTVTQGSLQ